jgi:hypothetical protein
MENLEWKFINQVDHFILEAFSDEKAQREGLRILKKLVPEVEDKLRSGSGIEYHSILPPVSMHYAVDEEDFEERLNRLSVEDLTYLVDRILDESECLLGISTEYAKIFVDVQQRRSQKRRQSG